VAEDGGEIFLVRRWSVVVGRWSVVVGRWFDFAKFSLADVASNVSTGRFYEEDRGFVWDGKYFSAGFGGKD
jgi:hypothetical protein